MSERRPADNRVREQAVEWGQASAQQSFIVQAPAGSGKTTLLVQRYLRLLAQVKAPERVLAITFTRKAAAELRIRVVRALSRAAGEEPPASEPGRRTHLLARAVLDKDEARPEAEAWRLVQNPSRLRIMTFDALCRELAARMPVLSTFGAVPEPTEEARPLASAAAARTLAAVSGGKEELNADIALLLDYLDNDWGKAQGLLTTMLLSRAQWRIDPGAPPTREELNAALDHAASHLLSRTAALIPEHTQTELMALCGYAAANLSGAQKGSPIAALEGHATLPPATDFAAWRGLCELLLSSKNEWRKTVNAAQGFPAKRAGALAHTFKRRMEDLLASLQNESLLLASLARVRRIPSTGFDPDQAGILAALHRVLIHAMGEMRVVIGEQGVADFSEISLRAEQALGRADAPSELLLRMDYALDHILVDEFQDTSWSQYRLLLKLTAGWQPGDGRSLFLVGDPMQSIYGFRDAEVGLFVDVRQRRKLGSLSLCPLSLSVNFRSSAGLVAWYNRCFSRVLPERSDAAIGAVAYSEAVPAPGCDAADPEAVVCHPSSDTMDEAKRVAETVADLRKDHPNDSIAILVRARNHLQDILPELRESMEAPVLGQKLFRLVEHPAAADLAALTRALLHPTDRVAWLALLRAPWCGLTRAELHALSEHAGADPIPEGLRRGMPETLGAKASRRLERVWELLQAARDNRHQRPLRDWVETTWAALGGPDCCLDATAWAVAFSWLDELEKLDKAGDLEDPPWLEQALSDHYAPPDPAADGRLQAMTIHQAKGLEFDHVILPGLNRYGRSDDDPLILWHELPGADATTSTLAAVRDAPRVAPDRATAYRFARVLDRERKDYELGRLLYVACTRARSSLHLFGVSHWDKKTGAVKSPDPRSFLYRLWPVVQDPFTPLEAPDEADESVVERPRLELKRLAADWEAPPVPPAVMGEQSPELVVAKARPIEYDWAGEPARIAGIVVHEYLRRIAQEGLDRWSAARLDDQRAFIEQRLRQYGLRTGALEETTTRVRQALTGALNEESGRWILGGHESARNEYALSFFEGGRLCSAVLDRTFVDDQGVRWIVDYKTGDTRGDVAAFLDREQERYRDQLEGYARVMRDLEGGGRAVKVALYYPLLGELRAWTPPLETVE